MSPAIRHLVVCLALVLFGCVGPNDSDLKRLDQVKRKWGEKYDVTINLSPYISVQAKSGVLPVDAELEEILREFRANDGGMKSDFVYLNVYDEKGKFQYQLLFDKGSITRSRAEFY